jgi:ATP-binding cassette subfamily G (WHITE) protein 2 (SNQ2)
VAFAIAFICALLYFTEFNTTMAAETSVVLFKRGSGVVDDVGGKASARDDEEKGAERSIEVGGERERAKERVESERALAQQARVTDVFSWQHLRYTVPIPGSEDRRLLDDVSGYVAPGKLTALMGESGAGKVRSPSSSSFLLGGAKAEYAFLDYAS